MKFFLGLLFGVTAASAIYSISATRHANRAIPRREAWPPPVAADLTAFEVRR